MSNPLLALPSHSLPFFSSLFHFPSCCSGAPRCLFWHIPPPSATLLCEALHLINISIPLLVSAGLNELIIISTSKCALLSLPESQVSPSATSWKTQSEGVMSQSRRRRGSRESAVHLPCSQIPGLFLGQLPADATHCKTRHWPSYYYSRGHCWFGTNHPCPPPRTVFWNPFSSSLTILRVYVT